VYGQNSGGALKTASFDSVGATSATNPSGIVANPFSTASNAPGTWENTYYGAASVGWAPGGGFTSSLKGEVYSDGAYRATFSAAKNFQ